MTSHGRHHQPISSQDPSSHPTQQPSYGQRAQSVSGKNYHLHQQRYQISRGFPYIGDVLLSLGNHMLGGSSSAVHGTLLQPYHHINWRLHILGISQFLPLQLLTRSCIPQLATLRTQTHGSRPIASTAPIVLPIAIFTWSSISSAMVGRIPS